MTKTQQELKKLIPLYCEELEVIDVSEFQNYEFSNSYIANKEKLIKSRSRMYYPFVKNTGRKLAFAAVAAAIMGVITVAAYEPARETVKDFFVRIFKNYSVVTASDGGETADAHKDKIQYKYKIDVPHEFILSQGESVENDTFVSTSYYTEDGARSLNFTQCTADSYVSYFDNGHTKLVEKTDKFGNKILVHNYNDTFVSIIWDNGEYIFDLSGDMSEAKMMDIYYTVK